MTNTAIIRRLLLMLLMGLLTLQGLAQDNTLEVGDPPLASRITVATVDDVTVTIIGDAGFIEAAFG